MNFVCLFNDFPVAAGNGGKVPAALGASIKNSPQNAFAPRLSRTPETRLRLIVRRLKFQLAIASRRRLVTGGPKKPMTMNTTTMAPAMKLNTPVVP